MTGVFAVAAIYLFVVAVAHYARVRRARVDTRRWADAIAALARIHRKTRHADNERCATARRLDDPRRVQGVDVDHVPGHAAGETPRRP